MVTKTQDGIGTPSLIEPAIEAARRGDAPALKDWLERGNPNTHDRQGWTPLLWAAVRGHREAVETLLDHPLHPADPSVPHAISGGLAIHLAGHSGDVDTVLAIVDRVPEQLNSVWDINGHAVLLQGSFYGHIPLAKALLERGADMTITTARGLGPLEMATQFQNLQMMDLLRPYDVSTEAKAAYYRSYLARIAPKVDPADREEQDIADRLVATIEHGLHRAAADPTAAASVLAEVRALVGRVADVNRLAGPLQQPALIVASTGNNGWPADPVLADLRLALADVLLEHGASPLVCEKHPMAVQTIIRAAVFNHLALLKRCAQVLTAQELADGINMVPSVNGLTGMHDTVLRSTMAGEDRIDGYLAQVAFFVASGARIDLEDFSGVTQRHLADRELDPRRHARLVDFLEGRLGEADLQPH